MITRVKSTFIAAAVSAMTLGGLAKAPVFAAQGDYARPWAETSERNQRRAGKRDGKRRKAYRNKRGRGARGRRLRIPMFGSVDTPGTMSEDTRHDCYLHSHARAGRHLRWAIGNGTKPYPYDDERKKNAATVRREAAERARINREMLSDFVPSPI